jgi:hypothetical protein
MQGILMEHKSNPQNPPRGCLMEHQPVVLLMSQSAGSALLDKLGEKNSDGEYLWSDLTDLNGGMFIQFHQAGTQGGGGNAAAPRQMTQSVGGGNASDNNRYEVEFREHYNNIAPTFDNIHELAQAHVKPWDEIVRLPTIEEQVRMLCSAGIPASAIVYALGDVYGEYIPQHIFDQASGQRQQATVPFQSVDPGQGDANPMQPRGGNPMTQQMGTQPDPSMPAAQPEQSVGQPASAPAQSMQQMTSTPSQTPPQEAAQEAPQAPFDQQPTHASGARSQATMDALQRARDRQAAQR